MKEGLGGIMFWAIDYEDFNGDCFGRRFPLIEAGKTALSAPPPLYAFYILLTNLLILRCKRFFYNTNLFIIAFDRSTKLGIDSLQLGLKRKWKSFLGQSLSPAKLNPKTLERQSRTAVYFLELELS